MTGDGLPRGAAGVALGHDGEPRRVLATITQTLVFSASLLGVDMGRAIAAAGLSPQELAEQDTWLDLDRHLVLAHHILEQKPDLPFGLLTGQLMTTALLGPLGYVARSASTLAVAYRDIVRFQHLLTNCWRWQVDKRSDTQVLGPRYLDPELEALAHPMEAFVTGWVSMGRQLSGTRFSPREVSFSHKAQGECAGHEEFFGCAVHFNAPRTELVLSSDTLQLPVQGAHPELRQPMVRRLQSVLAGLGPALPGYAGQVRSQIQKALPGNVPPQQRVAAQLGVTERTLQRRLEQESVSFSALVDTVRSETAAALLSDPGLSVTEVAFLTGFSEPSTFYRAFRRWTGTTPAAYRAKLGRQTATETHL